LYFCAEFGVHNSLHCSGGLGILAGDHFKSTSDLHAVGHHRLFLALDIFDSA
jgi:glucan phosphorylase